MTEDALVPLSKRRRKFGDKADPQLQQTAASPLLLNWNIAVLVYGFLPLMETDIKARNNVRLVCKTMSEHIRLFFKQLVVPCLQIDSTAKGILANGGYRLGMLSQVLSTWLTPSRVHGLDIVKCDNVLMNHREFTGLLGRFPHLERMSFLEEHNDHAHSLFQLGDSLRCVLRLQKLKYLSFVFQKRLPHWDYQLLELYRDVASLASSLVFLCISGTFRDEGMPLVTPLTSWSRLPFLETLDIDLGLGDPSLHNVLAKCGALRTLRLRLYACRTTPQIFDVFGYVRTAALALPNTTRALLEDLTISVLDQGHTILPPHEDDHDHPHVPYVDMLASWLPFTRLESCAVLFPRVWPHLLLEHTPSEHDASRPSVQHVLMRMLKEWTRIKCLAVSATVDEQFVKESMYVAPQCSLRLVSVAGYCADLTSLGQWCSWHPSSPLLPHVGARYQITSPDQTDWKALARAFNHSASKSLTLDMTDGCLATTKQGRYCMTALSRLLEASSLDHLEDLVLLRVAVDADWSPKLDLLPARTCILGELDFAAGFFARHEPFDEKQPFRILVFGRPDDLTMRFVRDKHLLGFVRRSPLSGFDGEQDADADILPVLVQTMDYTERWTFATPFVTGLCAKVQSWRLSNSNVIVRLVQAFSRPLGLSDALTVIGGQAEQQVNNDDDEEQEEDDEEEDEEEEEEEEEDDQ